MTDIDIADQRYEYYDRTAKGLGHCVGELRNVAACLVQCAANADAIREHRRSRYHALLAAQAEALSDLLGEFASSHRASATYFGRECDRLIDAEKTSPMVAVARQPRGIRMDRVCQRGKSL